MSYGKLFFTFALTKNNTNMIIQFGNINNSLGTRSLGSKLRLEIEENLKKGEFVSFDFSNVDVVSHSFADECFGKLLLKWEIEELKKTTTFTNVNPFVKKIISFTLKERQHKLELASN